MSDSPSTPSRRALLRNAAALGVVAVPGYSLLSACAYGNRDFARALEHLAEGAQMGKIVLRHDP